MHTTPNKLSRDCPPSLFNRARPVFVYAVSVYAVRNVVSSLQLSAVCHHADIHLPRSSSLAIISSDRWRSDRLISPAWLVSSIPRCDPRNAPKTGVLERRAVAHRLQMETVVFDAQTLAARRDPSQTPSISGIGVRSKTVFQSTDEMKGPCRCNSTRGLTQMSPPVTLGWCHAPL